MIFIVLLHLFIMFDERICKENSWACQIGLKNIFYLFLLLSHSIDIIGYVIKTSKTRNNNIDTEFQQKKKRSKKKSNSFISYNFEASFLNVSILYYSFYIIIKSLQKSLSDCYYFGNTSTTVQRTQSTYTTRL